MEWTDSPKAIRERYVGGLIFIGIAACLVGLLFLYVYVMKYDTVTIIDELKSGNVSISEISKVSFFKFDRLNTGPLNKSVFRKMKFHPLESNTQIIELMNIFVNKTHKGHKYRNHPSLKYTGGLKIETYKGKIYYNIYELYCTRSDYKVNIDANCEGCTNFNKALNYYSIELNDFLKTNDPWYKPCSE